MSNKKNFRRKGEKRTEHGPTWENRNPGKGSNSTHVARARAAWKRILNRALRRTDGESSGGYYGNSLDKRPKED